LHFGEQFVVIEKARGPMLALIGHIQRRPIREAVLHATRAAGVEATATRGEAVQFLFRGEFDVGVPSLTRIGGRH
jgi:hypothetical protein